MDTLLIKEILSKLKTKKGIPAKEFAHLDRYEEYYEQYGMTDGPAIDERFDLARLLTKEWGDLDPPPATTWDDSNRESANDVMKLYPIDEIRQLAELGLIEAYSDDDTLLSHADINSNNVKSLTLFISPLAVKIEYLLGINLTNKSLFSSPHNKKKMPDLFTLMPFTSEMKPIFEDHIKRVASELGMKAARADDFFTGGSIMEDVWSAINYAEIIVADCTHRNPNVFYEIGIAHTLGKKSILISQSIDDIPFDLRHLRILIYEYTPRGMAKMEQDLKFAIQSLMSE